MRTVLKSTVVLAAVVLFFVSFSAYGNDHNKGLGTIRIDADDIGGKVVGPRGDCVDVAAPKKGNCDHFAGVWVIAETNGLPTKFRKVVVTDELGRFVIPDLPDATYDVWVRGYGLVDSTPVRARPGQRLVLHASHASTPQEAARIYPGNYWYSLIEPPAPHEFPGTGPAGNGISPAMTSQADWVSEMKLGCQLCHQMGNRPTQLVDHLDHHTSGAAAFDEHVQSGQRGFQMSGMTSSFGRARALAMFGDWAERIAAGEVPPTPPRPRGPERNVVLTMWEWGDGISYVHDEIVTDKRNPTVNANGPAYGVEFGNDRLLITDPVAHTSTEVKVPLRDDPATVPTFFPQAVLRPSDVWGDQIIWTNRANPHNPMVDHKGRVWITTRIRGFLNPAFCGAGSDHPSALVFPLNFSVRQLGYYDPSTEEFVLIDTCYSTHHLQFAEDADHTLWLSGDSNVIGWFNTRLFDETGDAASAQGWCPVIADTNGDGVIGAYVQPNQPVNPALDKRFSGFNYGIIPNPRDGTIWTAQLSAFPGRIVRLDPGPNPPWTCKSEVYEPPSIENPTVDPRATGHGPRGIDADRNGLLWTGLGGSGHLARFDRSKCSILNGPTATGQQCPEGWTLYAAPGPQMRGVTDPGSADFHYYNWVDQFNTFGLGENVPIVNGSGSDSLLALNPTTGEWTVLRVPYPMGFYSRGLDGRIDDPSAGWKGRGLWADFGTNVAWHIEGGMGAIVRFQLRPHPLAH